MAEKRRPQPPAKPAYRTVNNLAKTIKVMPYFLAGDPEVIKTHMKEHRENELFEMEDIFAVGVGHLKFKHHLNYENVYAETLDQSANKLMYVFYALTKRANPDMDTNEQPPLVTHDDTRITETPYGEMFGSLEKNGHLLLTFLLSQFGRIVGKNGDGTYEYEEVTTEDLIDLLDPDALFAIDENDGQSIFMTILEMTGLYDPAKQAKRLTEQGTVKEDDLKNSASRKGDT